MASFFLEKMAARREKSAVKVYLHDDSMSSMDAESKGLLHPRHGEAAEKESCVICLDYDVDFNLMFSVSDQCSHRFCFNCVKKHIEVQLLSGTLPKCLLYGCRSSLSFDKCGKLLTDLKLSLMWEQRIKEDSTPMNERVYCPYQSCSYLMSKTELSSSDESALRRCFKCDGSFCLHCKVPWHSALSCNQYKKLHPNPQVDDEDFAKLKSMAKRKGWRQCGKCKHMIERSGGGCNRMLCRCGYTFCYGCGKHYWDGSSHLHCHPRIYQFGNEVPRAFPVWLLGIIVSAYSTVLYIQYSSGKFQEKVQVEPRREKSKGADDFLDFLFSFL